MELLAVSRRMILQEERKKQWMDASESAEGSSKIRSGRSLLD